MRLYSPVVTTGFHLNSRVLWHEGMACLVGHRMLEGVRHQPPDQFRDGLSLVRMEIGPQQEEMCVLSIGSGEDFK